MWKNYIYKKYKHLRFGVLSHLASFSWGIQIATTINKPNRVVPFYECNCLYHWGWSIWTHRILCDKFLISRILCLWCIYSNVLSSHTISTIKLWAYSRVNTIVSQFSTPIVFLCWNYQIIVPNDLYRPHSILRCIPTNYQLSHFSVNLPNQNLSSSEPTQYEPMKFDRINHKIIVPKINS